MQIKLTSEAVEHIQSKGGQVGAELVCACVGGGIYDEVSVDTLIPRRNTGPYRKIKQDDVELFILPELAKHIDTITIDSKKFLFFRNLKAELEMENGLVLGRRASWA